MTAAWRARQEAVRGLWGADRPGTGGFPTGVLRGPQIGGGLKPQIPTHTGFLAPNRRDTTDLT